MLYSYLGSDSYRPYLVFLPGSDSYRLCRVFLPRVCHPAASDAGGATPHPQQPVTRPREAVGQLQHRRRGAQRRHDGSPLPPGRHRGGRVAGEPKGEPMAGLGVLA